MATVITGSGRNAGGAIVASNAHKVRKRSLKGNCLERLTFAESYLCRQTTCGHGVPDSMLASVYG